jgi:hypothetical protein
MTKRLFLFFNMSLKKVAIISGTLSDIMCYKSQNNVFYCFKLIIFHNIAK